MSGEDADVMCPWKTVEALFNLLIICYSPKIISFVADSAQKMGQRWLSAGVRARRLREELSLARDQLSLISPTGQFAQYARQRRQIDSIRDKLRIQSKTATTTTLAIRLIVQALLYFLVALASVYMAYAYYGVAVARFDSDLFFPLNPLLSFPGLATTDQYCNLSYHTLGLVVFYVSRMNSAY